MFGSGFMAALHALKDVAIEDIQDVIGFLNNFRQT